MSSASILMNLPAATPVAAAGAVAASAAHTPDAVPGFTHALAAAQADGATDNGASTTGTVSLELVSGLLLKAAGPNGNSGATASVAGSDMADAAADAAEAAESGAAAILAQMLMGAAQPAPDAAPPADALNAGMSLPAEASRAALPQSVKATGAQRSVGTASGADEADVDEDGSALLKSEVMAGDPLLHDAPAITSVLLQKPAESSLSPASPAPQSGAGAQAALQAAATALRDSPAAQATTVHASLREPVGSARWADELGNRLVLMSVRGQQQGSLMLTPEHLGPVEVQISVNRDTTNVWFSAQHADTRAALTEAMPRLRELLAAGGLSLGQSSVSEQAPREGFTTPQSIPGSAAASATSGADAVEAPATWRRWNPGLVDTYA